MYICKLLSIHIHSCIKYIYFFDTYANYPTKWAEKDWHLYISLLIYICVKEIYICHYACLWELTALFILMHVWLHTYKHKCRHWYMHACVTRVWSIRFPCTGCFSSDNRENYKWKFPWYLFGISDLQKMVIQFTP